MSVIFNENSMGFEKERKIYFRKYIIELKMILDKFYLG
jgi:hypothetical protein